MKIHIIVLLFTFFLSCKPPVNMERVKAEIEKTEKDFARMTVDKSIAEAFYYYAADEAVIKRDNDSLIVGKDKIKLYYEAKKLEGATVSWSPDFIDISDCGNMAYTYGKYIWSIPDQNDSIIEYKGVFHTVWKRQADQQWKYVWD